MLIELNNGVKLNPLSVIAEKTVVQGRDRKILNFIFVEGITLEEVDHLFNEDNTRNIKITDDATEETYLYKDYSLRYELKKMNVPAESEDNQIHYQEQISVKMAQLTYEEIQLAKLVKSQAEQDEVIAELMFGGGDNE